MKRLFICLSALALCVTLSAEPAIVGKTEKELLTSKGRPISKAQVGTKVIYRWSDMQVWVEKGVVTSVTERAVEQEIEAKRKALKEGKEQLTAQQLKDAKEDKNRRINEKYQDKVKREHQQAKTEERQAHYEKQSLEMMEKEQAQAKIDEANRRQIYNQANADYNRRQDARTEAYKQKRK